MALRGFLYLLGLLVLTNQIQSEGTIYPCPPFGVGRLQHSTSCDRYVQCFAGVAVVRECAAGLHYSTKEEQCMDATLAQCSHDSDPCPLYNDPTNLVYIQDSVECGKYFLCYNRKMHEYSCAEGLHWDSVNQQCAYPEDAECEIYEIVCPNGGGQVPHPWICNRFYLCLDDGTYYPSTCPGDLVFDIETMRCNLKEVSTCASEVTIPTVPTEPTTPSTTTTTEEPTTERPEFECPNEEFQVFAHPWNGCRWYIVCENGIATESMCPLYTYYEDRFAICQAGVCTDPEQKLA